MDDHFIRIPYTVDKVKGTCKNENMEGQYRK
jgi:hypothetical protein